MALVSDYDLVRNTIALNCIAFDTKDWSLLQKVVTDDCVIHYPEPLGVTRGVVAYTERLQKAINHLDTQHAISIQFINLTSETTAEVVSYVRALHYLGERYYFADGMYEDKFVKVLIDGKVQWRIKERKASKRGVSSGDRSLLA
jgi:hypothetical protein